MSKLKRLQSKKYNTLIGSLMLAFGSLIWGISFVAQSEGGSVGSFTFQGVRWPLAFICLLIIMLVRDSAVGKAYGRGAFAQTKYTFKTNKNQLKAGIIAGLALSAASLLQQFGIDMQGKNVSAGRAGFLTALYIVLVPVFGIVLKRRVTAKSWISVGIGLIGLYLISIKKGAGLSFSTADIMLIGCAVMYTMQILTIDYYGETIDGVTLSCTQFGIASVISIILMFAFEKPDIHIILQNWLPICYSGILSGGVAFTLQILGQKRVSPVLASLLMSFESVFSALSDWIIRGNMLATRELIGCVVMFLAVIMAQLPEPKKKSKKQDNSEL